MGDKLIAAQATENNFIQRLAKLEKKIAEIEAALRALADRVTALEP